MRERDRRHQGDGDDDVASRRRDGGVDPGGKIDPIECEKGDGTTTSTMEGKEALSMIARAGHPF